MPYKIIDCKIKKLSFKLFFRSYSLGSVSSFSFMSRSQYTPNKDAAITVKDNHSGISFDVKTTFLNLHRPISPLGYNLIKTKFCKHP